MDLSSWMQRSITRASNEGVSGLGSSLKEVQDFLHRKYLSIGYPQGTPIYEREWDVLIILDACRLDLMEQVSDEFDFITDVDPYMSTGSTSVEWMEKNFTQKYQDEMRKTHYVCGNPFSEQTIDQESFLKVEEVWRHNWDSELGTIRPRPITDRVIRTYRSNPPNRMIVHYMQPHFPFIPEQIGEGMDVSNFDEEDDTATPWTLLESGKVGYDEVWGKYLDNLRYILEEVEFLLNNITADQVVITADHGNALGERGIYGHPYGWPLDSLRKVPWVQTSASDQGEYEPEIHTEGGDSTTNERLRALGYL